MEYPPSHIRMLQCVAVCYSVLQCAAVCCSVLQYVVVYCSVLQCAAVCCSVLQCVAVCCSVLQCAAVCCSVLQCATHDSVMEYPQSHIRISFVTHMNDISSHTSTRHVTHMNESKHMHEPHKSINASNEWLTWMHHINASHKCIT